MTGQAEGAATQRAERFALTLPVRYAHYRTHTWIEGVSVNISRTGLLFTTYGPPLTRGEQVDFLVHLPFADGAPGCEARCSGHVVRVVPPSSGDDRTLMAVTIDRYALAREQAAARQPASHSAR